MGFRIVGQKLLGFPAAHHQTPGVLRRERLQLGLLDDPAVDPVIEIVAAQGRIATGRHDFENTFGQLQDGDVEGAATQIINSVNALGALSRP
jgi:hypothetical protein